MIANFSNHVVPNRNVIHDRACLPVTPSFQANHSRFTAVHDAVQALAVKIGGPLWRVYMNDHSTRSLDRLKMNKSERELLLAYSHNFVGRSVGWDWSWELTVWTLYFGDIVPLKSDPVKTVLKAECEPTSLTMSRHIPFPLLPKVESPDSGHNWAGFSVLRLVCSRNYSKSDVKTVKGSWWSCCKNDSQICNNRWNLFMEQQG